MLWSLKRVLADLFPFENEFEKSSSIYEVNLANSAILLAWFQSTNYPIFQHLIKRFPHKCSEIIMNTIMVTKFDLQFGS